VFLLLNNQTTFASYFKFMLKYLVQCSEIGAGTRGSSLGPDAIMMASLNVESELFNRYPFEQIPDLNDSLFEPTSTPNALRIKQMLATWTAQSESVLRNMRLGKVPVILSGDHASAGGTIAGIKMAHPEKRLGVVWIDAHADLHTPYTTPSGNIHGMPLGASIATDNLDMQRNSPNEETVDYWERMKNLGGLSPKILPQDLIFVGVRDTEKEEIHLMTQHNIINYEVAEVDDMGMNNIGKEILEELKDCDIIYVSFDVDSMDPDEGSYGTGTPVQDGITPDQAKNLLSVLLADPKVVCFEMVEVNPLLDKKGNKMASTALSILEKAVETLENR